jgi:hypothetical protein
MVGGHSRHRPKYPVSNAEVSIMMVTRKAIPRRTILRGIGATLALPFLDGMVPALSAFAKTMGKPVTRFGAFYVPNGIMMKNWTPTAEGASFELTSTLTPLAPFRDQLLILSGLNSKPPAAVPGEGAGIHARASTRFLTDVPPKFTQNSEIEAGISMDQIAARELGGETQLASLELALESAELVGSCDVGFSCAYTNTISWRSPTTPLPMEYNPRAVFERLFGDSGSTDPAARLARTHQQRSVLDSIMSKVQRLEAQVGPADRAKLSEYFEAIRDVERRIQKAEEQSAVELPSIDEPAGIPLTFEEHAKLMCDLLVLAFQADLTRISTFMIGREFSGRTYPEIGVPDAHHPTSHHQNDPEKLAKLAKINTYHLRQFTYFLDRLRATPDGDGSLLDHSMLVYGAGMSDGNAHDPNNLPILLVGGAGQIKGGRHVKFAAGTPLANLHLTLLHKLGVSLDHLGDSNGEFGELSAV